MQNTVRCCSKFGIFVLLRFVWNDRNMFICYIIHEPIFHYKQYFFKHPSNTKIDDKFFHYETGCISSLQISRSSFQISTFKTKSKTVCDKVLEYITWQHLCYYSTFRGPLQEWLHQRGIPWRESACATAEVLWKQNLLWTMPSVHLNVRCDVFYFTLENTL